MNEFVRENLGKIVASFFAIVVWPAIILILEYFFFGRGIRGIKIIGRWTGNPDKQTLYDYTAYLFLEQSENAKFDRDVIGLIDWKVVQCPGLAAGAKCYEIVKGTMQKLSDKNIKAILILDTLSVTRPQVITASRYTIKLTKRCCSRVRCEGTTADRAGVNGDLQGTVRGRF